MTMNRHRLLVSGRSDRETPYLAIQFKASPAYINLTFTDIPSGVEVLLKDQADTAQLLSQVDGTFRFRVYPNLDGADHIQIRTFYNGVEAAPLERLDYLSFVEFTNTGVITELPSRLCDVFTKPYYLWHSLESMCMRTAGYDPLFGKIPETLFEGQTALVDVANMFNGQYLIEGNTPLYQGKKLWDTSLGITGTGCFADCEMLEDYGEIPEEWK